MSVCENGACPSLKWEGWEGDFLLKHKPVLQTFTGDRKFSDHFKRGTQPLRPNPINLGQLPFTKLLNKAEKAGKFQKLTIIPVRAVRGYH